MGTPKNILVIRLSALGDVAMTVPVLRVVAQTYPDITLTVLSRSHLEPLFQDIPNLQFLAANVEDEHKNLGLLNLAEEAKALGIDAVADLHNVLRSKAIRNYLLLKNGLLTAKIDKGRTQKKALTRASKSKKLAPLKTTHQRYAEVFDRLGLPIDFQNHEFPPAKPLTEELHNFIGQHTKKLIGIAPFAAYNSKTYPTESLKEVIAAIALTNNYELFLFGGKNEVDALSQLQLGFDNVKIVAGKFSFRDELKLISNLDGMLAMDSGNGHLAAMYGIPTITLWGVTHPYLGFQPFNQPNKNQLVANRDKYPLIPTSVYGNSFPEAYENCMESIPAALVIDKIMELF